MRAYDIRDPGGLALLEKACASLDEEAEFSAVIAAEGCMIRSKSGPRGALPDRGDLGQPVLRTDLVRIDRGGAHVLFWPLVRSARCCG
jgi:hypothetical protein